MWSSPDVLSLFSINVVSFSRNVVLRDPLFSLNSVSKPRMLSVLADYVLSSPQLEEKSELWISGKIRELLGKPELLAERRIDQHDLDEQAWLVTGGPKRLRVAQNGGPMSERHSGRTGLKCLLRQRRE
jgi:hypothetical protein